LVRCGSIYYGIENGSTPGTLVWIIETGKGITYGQPIPIILNQPLGDLPLQDPTQVAYDGKRLLIVADSGWATLDKIDFVRTEGTPIVAIPLSKDCKPI
jgi:hypothetical protein